MTTIRIVVTGHPVGKGRARTVRLPNGVSHSYTPAKTKRWEQDAREQARAAMGKRPPVSGPVILSMAVGFVVPQSWPAWKREAALAAHVCHTTRPDLDNVVKAVKDAFNGVVWLDDCQVDQIHATKLYAAIPAVHAWVTFMPFGAGEQNIGIRVGAQITKRSDLKEIDHDPRNL